MPQTEEIRGTRRLLIFLRFSLLGYTPGASAQKQRTNDVLRNFKQTRGEVGRPSNKTEAKRPLGLGHTIFKKNSNGQPVRVSSSQEFYEGDAVRFMIESNITGYLYIFHREDNELPKMLFPSNRLQASKNSIKAHVPYEVPSSREADPQFRWFYFLNDRLVFERFYFVVTREPLPEVPIEEKLAAYCGENSKDCYWKPTNLHWTQILADASKIESRESQEQASGRQQVAVERNSITRDVGLPPGAPSPAKVKMNISQRAGMLMREVVLVHKSK
ncbi:MAG TPA: DUF4384 domain-containing protein [Blastocatellia bacterium]|nr:DUF4384 domain-containing protein [Blastocatellia bacterium]HMV85647.1 DUF4384 domain-containing protein [Blastocatellia bacterium]HMX28948.1 DUF4384 domain-containing protein [Blastocatellia bacterium]HMZ20319.1 DUF4384 domain-containing protein [Blastocatellia bacterium]HNG29713.1 DUF4384 domain-containing protein [Blastocatellia bacterium]